MAFCICLWGGQFGLEHRRPGTSCSPCWTGLFGDRVELARVDVEAPFVALVGGELDADDDAAAVGVDDVFYLGFAALVAGHDDHDGFAGFGDEFSEGMDLDVGGVDPDGGLKRRMSACEMMAYGAPGLPESR